MAVAVQVGHVREAQADVSVHAHAARAAHVLDVVDALVSGCHNPLEDLDLHGIACMHHGGCVGVGVCVWGGVGCGVWVWGVGGGASKPKTKT